MALRVGIVSAAWGGMAHLPAWRAVDGVEVTAICTSREETAKAAQQKFALPRAFWSVEEMCADPDIDIVDLGTRPDLRHPWILAALAHNKHIYNASPHACDWAAAKEIEAARARSSSVTCIDAFIEYVPAIRKMIEMHAAGYLGRPLGGMCHFNISLFNQASKQFPYNWFWKKSHGVSAIRNNGSHAFYPLIKMFGPIAQIMADDQQLLNEWHYAEGGIEKPETNDYCNAIVRFKSGMSIQMQISWSMTQHNGWLLDVFGEKGRLVTRAPSFPAAKDCTLEAGALGGAMERIAINEADLKPPHVRIDAHYPMPPSFPMALAMHNMVQEINGQGKASPSFAEAFEVERVQEAIRRSNASRSWVSLKEID